MPKTPENSQVLSALNDALYQAFSFMEDNKEQYDKDLKSLVFYSWLVVNSIYYESGVVDSSLDRLMALTRKFQ